MQLNLSHQSRGSGRFRRPESQPFFLPFPCPTPASAGVGQSHMYGKFACCWLGRVCGVMYGGAGSAGGHVAGACRSVFANNVCCMCHESERLHLLPVSACVAKRVAAASASEHMVEQYLPLQQCLQRPSRPALAALLSRMYSTLLRCAALCCAVLKSVAVSCPAVLCCAVLQQWP
jgi:hypothetical protein